MKTIVTHKEYTKACIRLEELVNQVDDKTPSTNSLAIEFVNCTQQIQSYEETHFSIGLPSLIETIELRMFEMKLKQKDLAILLNTNASRVSDYLSGKREVTLNVAKTLKQKLNIDSDIILQ